ncbi:MAG: hypothetical protein EAZ85_08930 [Bacteroidetes bacterium]|nr:MAG: hypothetical protein EAZ85_08930 [Bacteroidota bacterium]TAG88551.1 MAG: hypothetical protein EAZ20_08360 [Bacteroidota bacterium]
MYFKYLFLIFFWGLGEIILAQPSKTPALLPAVTEGYVRMGAMIGTAHYSGDIYSGLGFTRPSLGFFITRKISPHTHLRLNLSAGRIEGDDSKSPEGSVAYARNLHFRNDLKEIFVGFEYDLKASYGKHKKRKNFTPYFVAGIALLHHNPQAKTPTKLGGQWVDLQGLGTEGQGRIGYGTPYSKVQITIPVGIGVKFKIDNRWDFGIEIVPRLTFTDYLDDVGGAYPKLDDLGNPLAAAMSNRTLEPNSSLSGQKRNLELLYANFGTPISYTGFDGNIYQTLPPFQNGFTTRGGNQNRKDIYIFTGFHLSYIVDVGLKCPQFR